MHLFGLRCLLFFIICRPQRAGFDDVHLLPGSRACRSVAMRSCPSACGRGAWPWREGIFERNKATPWILPGYTHMALGNLMKSSLNSDWNGKFIYEWGIYHCHVWLPEGTSESLRKFWTLGRKENRQTHHVPETACWCCHFSTRWLSILFSLDFGHFQPRSPPQPLNPPSSQPIPYPWGFAIGQGCGGRRRAELGSGVDAAALPVLCWEGLAAWSLQISLWRQGS